MSRKQRTPEPTTAVTTSQPRLPKGWQWMRFDEIAHNVNTTCSSPKEAGLDRFVGLEHLEPRNLRIRSWGNIADGTTFNRVFRAGQVLFGKRRAYQRKAAVAHFDGLCSGDIYVFAANEKRLVPALLPFLVQSEGFAKHAEDTSEGSLSPRTKWKYLAEYKFALPSDPAEQRRIADLLRAADDAVEAWREALQKLHQLFSSLRLHIFKCTPSADGKFAVPNEISIGEGWQLKPLREIVDFLDHLRVPVSTEERSKRRGSYPYYGASGVIDSIDDYLFDEELILLGEDGANIVDRSTPLAFKVSGKIWVNNHAHVLRVKPPHDIDYVVEYLESISYLPFKTGTAQPKLNKAACESIPVPLPPSGEEVDCATTIKECKQVIAAVSCRIERSRELYCQILAHLLTPPSETP